MRLFLGFDGGGTKTACVLCDEAGMLLGAGMSGPSNYLYCGKALAAASVTEAQNQAFQQAGIPPQRVDTAYMASAAIRLHNGDRHMPFFRTCIDARHMICESDIYPIWFGGARERPAVVSIADTGSSTYVCRKDGFVRVGGWGPLLGDEGSGYDIGLQALRLTARMSDGRVGTDQNFVDAILQHFALSDARGMIRALNSGDTRSKVAGVARLVTEAAQAGNRTAMMLLENAAEQVVCAVTAACVQDTGTEPLPLILSGSLLQPGAPIFSRIQRMLPAYTDRISGVEYAAFAPAAAAAALALHSRGLDTAAERLLSQAGGVQI